MPRTERPLDSADSELGRFAADLRALRDKAGKPSYRALASQAHYSAVTLSDAAGGKKLPTLAVTLAYVTACGGKAEEWEQRWRDIAAPPAPTGDAPYVGLKAFQKEDADRFHGREKLTAKLVQLQTERGFVGVFGASGSGKSSLLRAGLLPRLNNALIFTPGVSPHDECAVRLAQLTGHSAAVLHNELADPRALGLLCKQQDLVLVVDQFEEIFTLCGPEQRDWFIKALTQAPRVVIGVRADFYGHVGRHPELVEALEGAQLLVGPMTTDELRRAITEPAQHVGATVESALVTRLVADVAGQAAALPLVQHALVETWHRRRGMTLSLTGYEEAGGVEHAVARTAEAVYEQLTEDQRQTARRIFLRLIALGEGTEDTKRRATRADLDAEVLEHLANARLVTLTEEHAELTHEALIRSWPRLRDWIAEDREALRVHHQLTEAAATWGGDRDLLYKGARLAQAAELSPDSLTEPERAFLTASQADGRRRALRARAVMAVLSVLVLLLAGTAVFAMRQSEQVTKQRDAAVAGVAAGESRRLALLPTDSGEAIRLALAAYRVAPTDANRDALLGNDAAARRERFQPMVAGTQFHKTVGGRFFAVGPSSTYTTKLWDLRAKETAPHMTIAGSPIAISDDDRRLLAYTETGIELLDISDPGKPRKLAGLPYQTNAAADSSLNTFAGLVHSRTAAAGMMPVVWTYDGAGGMRETAVPGDEPVVGVGLSPDGKTLVVSRSNPGSVELWRLDGGELRRVGRTFSQDMAYSAHFSPDGRFVLLTDQSTGTVRAWDISDPANPALWAELPVQPRADLAITFAPDSRRVLIGTERAAQIWDLEQRGEPALLASFENFPRNTTAFDYWPSKSGFVAVTEEAVWPLRTDAEQVAKELCLGGAALSDAEWAKYFPDVERVPVC
ncbi:XRE family transcriptional regulator [Lentzea alba]|uniref:nSTAND1 domain-containing NTPase n=1 Tax=Lentzea alba TaxID=2714351 RepID=UPI0039BF9E23